MLIPIILFLLLATAAVSPLAASPLAEQGDAGTAATSETLAQPPVLRNRSSQPNTVEVDLTAEPASVSLLPGKPATAWAYNGSVPGPTLEAREGDQVIIHFRNNLPAETTIHWHGLFLPVEADGNPMDPVPPGGSYDYVFTVHPGTAGTYWYHPHPHHTTGQQVARGLFGAILIRAADDPLPESIPEKLLILSDNRLDPATGRLLDVGELTDLYDLRNGREGEVLFVNSQIKPTVAIRSGEVQRWRVINASIARYYRLSLRGHTLLHVGTDGGLFEHPVEVKREEGLLLAPAERVELLVRGSGEPGSRTVLQSLPYDRYDPQTRPTADLGFLDPDQPLELANLQYTDEARVSPVAVPGTLRRVPALEPALATATQTVVMDLQSRFNINGAGFREFELTSDPMGTPDIVSSLNATEIWTIVNPIDEDDLVMDHPFHLHGFSFQLLDRGKVDGSGQPDWSTRVAEPFPAWKDTFNVPKLSWVRFIVQYKQYPGKRMFHCHILGHEDRGMMGIIEIK